MKLDKVKCSVIPFFFKLIFIEMQLLFNVVLVSGIEQSDSFIHLLLFSLWVVSHSSVAIWTIDSQIPLSIGLSKQAYWRGVPEPRIFLTQG